MSEEEGEDKKTQAEAKREAKRPSARDRAVKESKRVVRWATSRPSSKTIGTYKARGVDGGSKTKTKTVRRSSSGGNGYDSTPIDRDQDRHNSIGGFGDAGFGDAGFGGSGGFNNSPFSSGLSPQGKIKTWKPPQGF